MSDPLVSISVIIPAYNAEAHLAGALASVRAQTLPAMEIIVVDNASTDNTARIARENGAHCVHEPLSGAPHARNCGVAVARGNFFAFLDSDDLWVPQKLEWQMAALAAGPQIEAVYGHLEHFLSPDLSPAEAEGIHCPPGSSPARLPTLMLIRREAFERIGLFSTKMMLGDVVEWQARAESGGLRHAMLPHTVMHRRLHANNISRLNRDLRSDYIYIVKQKLERERAARLRDDP